MAYTGGAGELPTALPNHAPSPAKSGAARVRSPSIFPGTHVLLALVATPLALGLATSAVDQA